MDIVAVIGCITLVMAATIAIAQEDIKRVLAWSTVSQIGYMIMGVGLGRVLVRDVPLPHPRLLQGAAVPRRRHRHPRPGGRAEPRPMGGARAVPALRLRRPSPSAAWPSPACPGLPGFFSKDDILAHALARGGFGATCLCSAAIAAFLTAFYMFRLFFRVFARGRARRRLRAHTARRRAGR